MSVLADFILARPAEEERAARARIYGPPDATGNGDGVSAGRVLLHCAARRKLVALHEVHYLDGGQDVMLDGESGSCRAGLSERDFICPTLRLLALPYFDHADYKPDWHTRGDRDLATITHPA